MLIVFLLAAMPAVVIRQRKAWRRRDGVFLYFEVRPSFYLVVIGSQPPAGQRRCYSQPQGRDEGLCHYRPRGQRMRASTCVLLSATEADDYFWWHRPISGPVSPQTLVPWFERCFPLPFSLSSCSLHSCNAVT